MLIVKYNIITMVSKTELTDNYTAISSIPIVKKTLRCVSRLTKENKALVSENTMLKKMIDALFDRQTVSMKPGCCGCCNANKSLPEVYIKTENEAVVVDLSQSTSLTGENIVYELSDETTKNVDDVPLTGELVSEVTCVNEIDIKVEESADEEEEEVEVEESAEEEDEEVEVEESAEEEDEEVEVEESAEEEEEEVEVEESAEEEEEEVEVEESAEEEVEVEESAEEEEEEVEVEEEEEVEVEEEEEEEVYEITIKKKAYYTSNETDGPIYAITDDEDIGDQIGEFKNGKATFYKKK